MENKQEALEE